MGLLWALLAGYATRMVTPHLAGRAIAVAMVGMPPALSLDRRVMIDRWLRILTIASIMLFLIAAIPLGVGTTAAVNYDGELIWGLAFSGAATLFQTASTQAAGTAADVAHSMVVTVWNIAIAGGGLAGGYLLETQGAGALPWSLCALLVPCLAVVLLAGRHGFPSVRVQVEPSRR